MKAAPFDYRPAADLAEAQRALAADPAAKLAAGTQSLGPLMNLRLARPAALVDIARLAELRAVTRQDGMVRIGAAITHAEIEDGEVADPTPGWLAAAAAGIAVAFLFAVLRLAKIARSGTGEIHD